MQCVSPAVRESHCPNDSWGAPTASIFNDIYTVLASNLPSSSVDTSHSAVRLNAATRQAIKGVNLNSVIVFAHSIGVQVVTKLLGGKRKLFCLFCMLQTWQEILALSMMQLLPSIESLLMMLAWQLAAIHPNFAVKWSFKQLAVSVHACCNAAPAFHPIAMCFTSCHALGCITHHLGNIIIA